MGSAEGWLRKFVDGPQLLMPHSTLDVLYRLFIICHIAPTLLLAVPGVFPSCFLPLWSQKPLRWYLATYNDPLVGGKTFPGGWFGGLSACEVFLQLPYFLWAMTIPIGKIVLRRAIMTCQGTSGWSCPVSPTLFTLQLQSWSLCVICSLFLRLH